MHVLVVNNVCSRCKTSRRRCDRNSSRLFATARCGTHLQPEPDLDGALQNVVGVQLLQVVDEKYKTPALTIVRRASPMQLEAHPVQGRHRGQV